MLKFQITVAEVVNSVDYESASYSSRYFKIYGPGIHVYLYLPE